MVLCVQGMSWVLQPQRGYKMNLDVAKREFVRDKFCSQQLRGKHAENGNEYAHFDFITLQTTVGGSY